jgi:hypothetical protein
MVKLQNAFQARKTAATLAKFLKLSRCLLQPMAHHGEAQKLIRSLNQSHTQEDIHAAVMEGPEEIVDAKAAPLCYTVSYMGKPGRNFDTLKPPAPARVISSFCRKLISRHAAWRDGETQRLSRNVAVAHRPVAGRWLQETSGGVCRCGPALWFRVLAGISTMRGNLSISLFCRNPVSLWPVFQSTPG